MIELTERQQQELLAEVPIAIDPKTQKTYVLVLREAYERIKVRLAAEDYNPDEGGSFMNEVMADDDAKDPYLESYQARKIAQRSSS